jgi:DMSO/TMAO reductase YedYZ molybdopterin-dependent catalytic subunit
VEATVGDGLGKRRGLDLATLTPEALVTPADRFFIRTGRPARLPDARSWRVRVHGLVKDPLDIPVAELERQAEDRGVHLIECAGNSKAAHFGFMSVARWSGVLLPTFLERSKPLPSATQVLVAGFDEHEVLDRGSLAGASWIFTLDQLRAAGAFLATQMNGAPLLSDHGHPVRLVVPGWYGCTAVKWVNEIVLVNDDPPPTSHMTEYAGRTHQEAALPARARDFRPATLDPAATAVRVERLEDESGRASAYRVAGIAWGGARPARDLRIAVTASEAGRPVAESAFAPVDVVANEAALPWSLWAHTVRLPAPGRYRIDLKVGDPAVVTRRLDAGFYTREIEIGGS